MGGFVEEKYGVFAYEIRSLPHVMLESVEILLIQFTSLRFSVLSGLSTI